jgi:hypothetical protein
VDCSYIEHFLVTKLFYKLCWALVLDGLGAVGQSLARLSLVYYLDIADCVHCAVVRVPLVLQSIGFLSATCVFPPLLRTWPYLSCHSAIFAEIVVLIYIVHL